MLLLASFAPAWPTKADSHKTCIHFDFSNTNQQKAKDENQKAENLFAFIWNQWMQANPTWASSIGYSGFDDQWPDLSLQNITLQKLTTRCHLTLLKKISVKKLNSKNRISYDLLLKKTQLILDSYQFPEEYLQINQMEGLHLYFIDDIDSSPKTSLKNFQDKLQRMRTFPTYVDQTITLLDLGIKKKITTPKFLMKKTPDQVAKMIFKNPKESPLYQIMIEMPTSISNEERSKILLETQEVILSSINPALEKLHKFLQEKYIPEARESFSCSELPDGSNWYNYLIHHHTTIKKSALEIHNLGVKEVARIDDEMSQIREKLNFKGSKKEFHDFLKTDKQFYFTSAKDLISAYRDIAKQIDPELPRLFNPLPRLTYGVRPIAEQKAAASPTAYYFPGSAASNRAGYFEANTYNLDSRPKWEMEVLTVHEAVPGHHLQISLAQEQGDLPEFRKHLFYTAFIEGWGLYSEELGKDMNLYKDPYSHYGKLTFEMWRAVRLVVDTGMHTLGWSKEKALTYFMEYVPKDRLQSENEIDRYIAMPGQALAYKMGQLQILELKKQAQDQLGKNFDIKEFHKTILEQGAVPMETLSDVVHAWLNTKLKAQKKGH